MSVLNIALLAAWPALVFYGLDILEPRYLGAALVAAVMLRQRRKVGQLMATFSPLDRFMLLASLALAGGVMAANDEVLLRLYPALVNLAFLTMFAISLARPPSMVERFARLTEPELTAAGVRYTRTVTQIWCGFFVVNGSVAAWTAIWGSREAWALYNGLIAYVLMGILFGGELWCRRRWRARHA